MVKNKSGISAIVATVLVVLITVAGIAIIWAAIIPMINERVDFEATDVRLTINVEGGYTTWNENSKIASVQIKRGVDDSSDLSGIQVIFGMPDGVSVPFQLNESEIPGSNQMKVYHFNLSEKPLNVKIAPIFDGVIGEVSSETDYFGSTTKGLEVGDVFYSSNGGSGSGDGSGDGTTASTVECVSDSGCTGATEECMKNVCIGGVCGESVDVGAICDAGTCNSLGICEGCLGIDRFGLCDGDTGTCNSNDECVDGNLCTDDSCNLLTHKCVFVNMEKYYKRCNRKKPTIVSTIIDIPTRFYWKIKSWNNVSFPYLNTKPISPTFSFIYYFPAFSSNH